MPIRERSIDLDKLIHVLSCPPKRGKETRIDTERKINSILSLRTLLHSLGPGMFGNYESGARTRRRWQSHKLPVSRCLINSSSRSSERIERSLAGRVVSESAFARSLCDTELILMDRRARLETPQFLNSEQIDKISNSIQMTIDEDIAHAKGGVSSRNAKMVSIS